MELKFIPSISFNYGGKPFIAASVSEREPDDGIVRESLSGSLKVTTIARSFDDFGAIEWVSFFENIGSEPTEIISELNDCDLTLPFGHQNPSRSTAIIPDPDTLTHVKHVPGCSDPWREKEFCELDSSLKVGQCMSFACSGGRSSESIAPFFNISYQNKGIVVAIGWTGQWNFSVSRDEEKLTLRSGIEGISLRLLPGEKIRTSSTVIMPFEGDFADAQNKWRRLVKSHFSPIGKGDRDPNPPFCTGIWGGMSTDGVLARLKVIGEHKLPFEYIWMDAGWYGPSTQESPDEFEGDWHRYTGDWRVNETHHPDGLIEVRKAIAELGMKYLLWLEPERVIDGAPITKEHPEYFLRLPNNDNLILNLGDEAAWSYCFETLSELIERLKIDCYRQDFNTVPLGYWRSHDADDRRGITEIKHIMGLYRLWDALLERFPTLIIDNCASGGRRIDIETLRRSIPLWRTDYSCSANFRPEGPQTHAMGFGEWMPYSGTSNGRAWNDIYRTRSAYSSAMTCNFFYSERDAIVGDEACEAIGRFCDEYLSIRRYLTCDMYPLTEKNDSDNVWSAVEYFEPESDEGVILAFRHSDSPYSESEFRLRGLRKDARYTLTDADSGDVLSATGAQLENYILRIEAKRTSKLIYIKGEN